MATQKDGDMKLHEHVTLLILLWLVYIYTRLLRIFLMGWHGTMLIKRRIIPHKADRDGWMTGGPKKQDKNIARDKHSNPII